MSAYPKLYLYQRLVQAKLFIDRHYGEHIDLNDIADEASFSKFHFIRLFKTVYGKTPHQYLTKVRIGNAKRLLSNDTAVSEACYLVGFDSISSFTGLFKKVVGETPSSYQQQQLALKEDIATKPLKYIPTCFAEKNGWTNKSNIREAAL